VKVSAIVPAFNEEPRIAPVIGALRACGAVDQIIVIDDGSSDNTYDVAVASGAHVIKLEQNLGKGGAVARGLKEAHGDVILMVDADLIGLTARHIYALLEPVTSGRADMSIGLFDDGRPVTDLAQAITPWLSGQRALRRHVIDGLDIDISRFGVEAVLTRRAKEQHLKVVEVKLHRLTHMTKEEKMGSVKGVTSRVKMYWEVVKSLVQWE